MALDPAKDKKEKLIAITLIVVLVPLLLWNFNRQRRTKELRAKFEATGSGRSATVSAQSTLPPQAAPVNPPAESSTSSSELEKYVSTLKWKRDPFVLGIAQGEGGKTPTIQLKVSGIIYDETRPEATYAIINQEVVRIGDSFHGISVIDIQPAYVRLKKFGEELVLYLYQEEKNQ